MESDDDRGAEWLVEPPAQGQVRLFLAVGEDVELTPKARQALDMLFNELDVQDVVGFAQSCILVDCPDLQACGGYTCTLHKCRPLTRCLVEMSCEISKFGIL